MTPVCALLVALTAGVSLGLEPLDVDRGASGTWLKLLKLRTTASAMHVAAHPDEEAGGVMARLGRHDGARVASLTLTRGEAGDNALGPQAFDALGLLRTEELIVSNRYYGVDEQYFTTFADLGFTKRSDEAFNRWGRHELLREVVRAIRTSRPLVLFSRFQGTARDGHGSTSAATLVMVEAFTAASNPAMFPEQLRDGLHPWQPLKLYIGAASAAESTITVDTGAYSPWLGQSYSEMARRGLGFQRSSVSPVNARRHYVAAGPEPSAFIRVRSAVAAKPTEASFFDGIDTSIRGAFRMLGKAEPSGAATRLAAIASAVDRAVASFSAQDPSAAVPALADGLTATRAALAAFEDDEPDVRYLLHVKERQFQDAINTALGVDLTALAQPSGATDPAGPPAALSPPPAMAPPVPGQTFEVRARLTNRGSLPIAPTEISLRTDRGWTVGKTAASLEALGPNDQATQSFTVKLAPDAPLSSRPYFRRGSIRDARYTLSDPTKAGLPAAAPPATAFARYTVAGVAVEKTRVVQRRESKLPYGEILRELHVVPALSVRIAPERAVVSLHAPTRDLAVTVDLLNNHDGPVSGALALTLPETWRAEPSTQAFRFDRAGERRSYPFTVTMSVIESRAYSIAAVATVDGVDHVDGYEIVDQRDLELRYLYRPATMQVRGVDVRVVPGLTIGYVMGAGDHVPAGIEQLGYPVVLLTEADLATGNLTRFDTIVTGTRAYAVRPDLVTHHGRLLDYVRQGGNLVVLYNTHELVPDRSAPYPGQLPPAAEEVSEEDSPVEILAAAHQSLTWPNRISPDDFEGWIEQRGSKFWATWDAAYTPVIATHDQGQAPQGGGWLTTRYGKGTWTYFAYALHRQLPEGVPGAYRIAANLLALARTPPARR